MSQEWQFAHTRHEIARGSHMGVPSCAPSCDNPLDEPIRLADFTISLSLTPVSWAHAGRHTSDGDPCNPDRGSLAFSGHVSADNHTLSNAPDLFQPLKVNGTKPDSTGAENRVGRPHGAANSSPPLARIAAIRCFGNRRVRGRTRKSKMDRRMPFPHTGRKSQRKPCKPHWSGGWPGKATNGPERPHK